MDTKSMNMKYVSPHQQLAMGKHPVVGKTAKVKTAPENAKGSGQRYSAMAAPVGNLVC